MFPSTIDNFDVAKIYFVLTKLLTLLDICDAGCNQRPRMCCTGRNMSCASLELPVSHHHRHSHRERPPQVNVLASRDGYSPIVEEMMPLPRYVGEGFSGISGIDDYSDTGIYVSGEGSGLLDDTKIKFVIYDKDAAKMKLGPIMDGDEYMDIGDPTRLRPEYREFRQASEEVIFRPVDYVADEHGSHQGRRRNKNEDVVNWAKLMSNRVVDGHVGGMDDYSDTSIYISGEGSGLHDDAKIKFVINDKDAAKMQLHPILDGDEYADIGDPTLLQPKHREFRQASEEVVLDPEDYVDGEHGWHQGRRRNENADVVNWAKLMSYRVVEEHIGGPEIRSEDLRMHPSTSSHNAKMGSICYCDSDCKLLNDCCSDYEYTCPIRDCEVTQWTPWGPCSGPPTEALAGQGACSQGVSTRNRFVIHEAENGGRSCPFLVEETACSRQVDTPECANLAEDDVAIILSYNLSETRQGAYRSSQYYDHPNMIAELNKLESYCLTYRVTYVSPQCERVKEIAYHDFKIAVGDSICSECQPRAQYPHSDRKCRGEGGEGVETTWVISNQATCYGFWIQEKHELNCKCAGRTEQSFIFV